MLTTLNKANHLIVYDFSNLSYAVYYSNLNNGLNIFYLALNKILSFIKDKVLEEETAIVFALDNFPQHKKDLVPSYKENRKPLENDPRPVLKAMLMNTGVYFAEVPGEEADDVIASICSLYYDKKISIVSTDHDLLQLCKYDYVSIYRTLTGEKFELKDLEEKYGLNEWSKIPLYKMVFGDSSDSIKAGLPRVRKKEILPVINASKPLFKDFMSALDQSEQSKRTKDLIEANRDVMKNNYKIVKLNTQLDVKFTRGGRDVEGFQDVLNQQRIKIITKSEYKFLF